MGKLEEQFIDACTEGNLKKVKAIVAKGADVHYYYNWPIQQVCYLGYLEVVKYLVSQGADIHADEERALRWACYYGHLEVAKYLLSQGAFVTKEVLEEAEDNLPSLYPDLLALHKQQNL